MGTLHEEEDVVVLALTRVVFEEGDVGEVVSLLRDAKLAFLVLDESEVGVGQVNLCLQFLSDGRDFDIDEQLLGDCHRSGRLEQVSYEWTHNMQEEDVDVKRAIVEGEQLVVPEGFVAFHDHIQGQHFQGDLVDFNRKRQSWVPQRELDAVGEALVQLRLDEIDGLDLLGGE